jgi:hypothetical protein
MDGKGGWKYPGRWDCTASSIAVAFIPKKRDSCTRWKVEDRRWEVKSKDYGHETRSRVTVFGGFWVFGFGALGKLLILLGVFIILIGLFLLMGEKIPWIGRLPGDIIIKKEKFTFYFPITTSILISIILTLLFWIFRR